MNVRSLINLVALALAIFAAPAASAAHTQASLVLAAAAARPGDTILAGVRLRMDPGWHIYWRNPGASGIATSIQWSLPAGVTAGAVEWPLPKKLPPDDLTTYIYENDVVLVVPLTLASNLPPGPLELKAKVSWLECDEQCVPGSAPISAVLNVAPETTPSTHAALIASWRLKVPTPYRDPSGTVPAWWEQAANGDTRPLIIDANGDQCDFFPDANDAFEVGGASGKITDVSGISGKVLLRKSVKKFQGDWPAQIAGVLVTRSGGQESGAETKLAVQNNSPPPPTGTRSASQAAPAASSGGVQPPPQTLWRMLLYALLGGFILNFMPCVLPVIALKILGFVSESQSAPGRVRRLGLVYALGVLFSFIVLAGIVIAVKAAGNRAGWGLQFSSPCFLVGMATLVTLIALNLFGVFEVTLGSKALDAAGSLSSRHGTAGAFFNGLLATLLATSCTAPFLGAAVGFAFSQPPAIIVLILSTVGVGLAAPYVVLSWHPAWLRFLPKPGAWMEHFKVAMGFPMLAATVWLCSLTSAFYGDRAWALALFLVFVALAAWVFGRFAQQAARRRGLALAVTALLLLAGYEYALEGQLRWRQPIANTAAPASAEQAPDGADWEPWNLEAVARAQAADHPVLVDFTAKWCLTCQKNVKPVLGSRAVQQKLQQIGAVTFVADYTRFPDEITKELSLHGRAGVPLVLVYPGKAGAPPIVLPEVITSGIVLNALDQATKP
jgi:thiol:disulfide interchange protein DsbD